MSEKKFLPRGHIPRAQLKWFEDGATIYSSAMPQEPFCTVEYLSRQEAEEMVRQAREKAFDAVLEQAQKLYEEEMDSDPSDYFYTRQAVEKARAEEGEA